MNKKQQTTKDVRDILPPLAQLEDQELAEKIASAWLDAFEQSHFEKLEDVPQNLVFETFVSLVDHVNGLCEMCVSVCRTMKKFYPHVRCDEQLLVAHALMHDISKILEFEPDGNGQYRISALGEQFQHATLGAHLALKHGLGQKMAHLTLTHTAHCDVRATLTEGTLFYYLDHLQYYTVLFKDTYRDFD
jgi:hypothetical protein